MGDSSSSNVFRAEVPGQKVESKPDVYKEDVPRSGESDEEVPFTDYQQKHNHPFLVDHFKLGDSWQEKVGGFEKEINNIEGYFKDKIERGELKNEKAAVLDKMKKIYKLVGIENSERITMQIEKLSAYIDFLKKTDEMYYNRYRYAR